MRSVRDCPPDAQRLPHPAGIGPLLTASYMSSSTDVAIDWTSMKTFTGGRLRVFP